MSLEHICILSPHVKHPLLDVWLHSVVLDEEELLFCSCFSNTISTWVGETDWTRRVSDMCRPVTYSKLHPFHPPTATIALHISMPNWKHHRFKTKLPPCPTVTDTTDTVRGMSEDGRAGICEKILCSLISLRRNVPIDKIKIRHTLEDGAAFQGSWVASFLPLLPFSHLWHLHTVTVKLSVQEQDLKQETAGELMFT